MKSINDVIRSISRPTVLIAGMAFLVGMLTVFPTFSASFDCAKARTKSEKIVCADPALSRLDEELSRMYAQAREASADKQALTQEQRLWINSERDKCSDAICMIQACKTRMMQLDKTLPKNRDEAGGSNDPSTENTKSVATDASPPGKAKDGVQPDPVRWAEIDRWLINRQKDFVSHLDSAQKLELSKVREPFPWQIDWPSVEKWCESITRGLEGRLIKFPEPSAAVLRDGCQGVRNAVNTAFPICGNRFQQGIVDNACKRSDTWMYLFPGTAYAIEDTMLTRTDSRRITNAITPIYGEGCPSEEGLVFDEMSVAWLTEGDVRSYFPTPQVVLIEVAGEPVIAVFGFYSTADTTGPPYKYNYKYLWQKMNKCKGCSPGAFTSTGDSNAWKQVPGYPGEPPFRWGVPGQGFVMINGVRGSNIWHSPWTKVPSSKIMDIIGDYPVDTVISKYLSEWQTGFLHACIINFDHK